MDKASIITNGRLVLRREVCIEEGMYCSVKSILTKNVTDE